MADSSSNVTTIAVAAIGAIGAIAAAAFANWDKIVRPEPAPSPPVVRVTPAPEPPAPSAVVKTAQEGTDSKVPPLRIANLVGEWKSTLTSPEPIFGALRLRSEGALVHFSALAAKPCGDAAGCAYNVMLDPEQATVNEGRREWRLPKSPLAGATWAPPGMTAVSMIVTRNIAEPRKLYAHVTLYGGKTTEYDDIFIRP